jgi:sugar phosphate isomerase/epimerase
MRFSAPVWPFQWNPPYADAIRRIAALGFQQVELIAWNRAALAEYYTPSQVRELRALLDDLGLSVSEFVSTAAGMASPERAQQDQCVEHFRRMCDTAHALGTTIVNTVSPAPFELRTPPLKQLPITQLWTAEIPEGLDWQRGWEEFVATVRRVVSVVEEAGLRYAMEPHPYRYVSSAAGMLRLIDHVPSPALGMNFDPSHLFPCGDLPQLSVYQLGGRIFHCHFSDNDAVTNAHWRPGAGKIDWHAVLKALRDTGYDGAISIELEDVPGVAGGPRPTATPEFDTEMKLSLEYLEALGNELGIRWGA